MQQGPENVNVNITSDVQPTPLFVAAQNGNLEILKMLMRHPKIEPNKGMDPNNATPFFIAAYSGQTEVVAELLQYATVDANQASFEPLTPLGAAVKNRHPDIVKLLLDSDKVDSRQQNRDGETFYLVCKHRDMLMMNIFIARELRFIKAGIDFLKENYVIDSEGLSAAQKFLSDKVVKLVGESGVVLYLATSLKIFGDELKKTDHVMPEMLVVQQKLGEYCSVLWDMLNTAPVITPENFSQSMDFLDETKAAIEGNCLSMRSSLRL